MSTARPFRIIQSASAATRLDAALAFLRTLPPSQAVNIVGATRGAADDLARRVALERVATFGLARYSLTQLAARIAVVRLAQRELTAATALGAEAVAARAAFHTVDRADLEYLAPVAQTPGFARALAQTLSELRAARIPADVVRRGGGAGPDLAVLLTRADREFVEAGTADRARLFAAATEGVHEVAELRAPLVLLDVAIESAAEADFLEAIGSLATHVVATVPYGDTGSSVPLERAGGVPEQIEEPVSSGLGQLRRFLFSDAAPPLREPDATVQFFSAPGEGREAIEIARRILDEARRGTPFDEIAIVVRATAHYHGLLEHALRRAGIPAWFDRGTRRPHPAGRAFLALLACAAEGLSAGRFAEYLSLGQIPAGDLVASALAGQASTTTDEVSAGFRGDEDLDTAAEASRTVASPRRWERLIVEASVIGGNPARWSRRLDGLRAQFTKQLEEAQRDDPESARVLGIERDLERLAELRSFALPVIARMAEWPASASWGAWLKELESFAPTVVQAPAYVLRILADLRPMSAVGPASLDEVRAVLTDRLRLIDTEPPARRYGRVLVSSPARVRGRTFRVVFVPGLAERMFPAKPRQDPLLPDEAREQVNAAEEPHDWTSLPTRGERAQQERLLLRLAVGAASRRVYVSYPRLEVAEGRARVPSFYALDVLRAATGRIPEHDALARTAAEVGDPSLAWPAPVDPVHAIDDLEHDLSVLRTLLDAGDADTVRGHAQYILRQNPALWRSVTSRWARAERKWSPFDGITRLNDRTRDALASQRLGARPYSVSALQRFAACPYQFLLGAIYRLQPAERPQPLQRLDPLTKGSFFHRVQATLFRTLADRGALPVTQASLDAAVTTLDEVVAEVAARYREQLLPAIDRVWRDQIDEMTRDLRGWLRRVAIDGDQWMPRYFELSFGLPFDEDRDPHSVGTPAVIDDRFVLRGSVDLVEEHRQNGSLRVTDHKTGKNRISTPLVIGGGTVLQPLLYSLAVERVTGQSVSEARLSFCTAAAGYAVQHAVLDLPARRSAIEALEIVDRAVERGELAAAPASGACAWCDYRVVCGPHEEERAGRKPQEWLRDLHVLRSQP